MPTYEFTCPHCLAFDAAFTMADVPDTTACIHCGASSPRRITAPRISRSGSTAFQIMDATKRSAHIPDVVSTIPGARTERPRNVSPNPLHAKLPRP